MAGGTRSSDSSVDEIVAALDALFAADRARKAIDFAKLQNIVAGLGIGTEAEPEVSTDPRRPPAPTAPARGPSPEPVAYPILPRRSTHGGPFGASIVDRVAASVRKESDW